MLFESASFTVCAGVNGAVEPSSNVTVVVPFSPTSTVLTFVLTFRISASTLPFSSLVKAPVFFTGVTAGTLMLFESASFIGTVIVVLSLASLFPK